MRLAWLVPLVPSRNPSTSFTTAVTVRSDDSMNIPVPLSDGQLVGVQRFDLAGSRGYAFSLVRGYSPDGSARVYDPGTEPTECLVRRTEWQLVSGAGLPIEVAWSEDFARTPGCTVRADWLPPASCHAELRVRFELIEECAPPATIVSDVSGTDLSYRCAR